MQKQNKALLLLGLMLLATHMDVVARKSRMSKFWTGVGAVATAVAVGVGAAKLVEWCCSESNRQLIIRGESVYQQALCYTDIMVLVEQAYSVQAYPFYYHSNNGFTNQQTERILFDVATALFNRGYSQTGYVYDVYQSKQQLSSLKNSLYTRINEARGKYLNYEETRDLNDMRLLVDKIDRIEPRITFFADYLNRHNNYFALYECEARLLKYYTAELSIAQNRPTCYDAILQLRKEIMWRHVHSRFPLTIFVDRLSSDTSSLKSHINGASAYRERTGYAWALVNSFEWINKMVMSDERYSHEAYLAEQDRLERLRLETLHEHAWAAHDRIQAKNERRQARHEREIAQHEREAAEHDRERAECERKRAQCERERAQQAVQERYSQKSQPEAAYNVRDHKVDKDIAGFDHCCGI